MHFKIDVTIDWESVKQTQKQVGPWWPSTEEESADEELWLRTEKALEKESGSNNKEAGAPLPCCLFCQFAPRKWEEVQPD